MRRTMLVLGLTSDVAVKQRGGGKGMKTLSLKGLSGVLAIALVLGGIATETWAVEKGRFRGRAVLVLTKYEESIVPDAPGHVLSQYERDGVFFNETGGTFLDTARYQVIGRGDKSQDGLTANGYKIFTMPDGSQIFAKFEGKFSGGHLVGTLMLIGGTGKYQGVKGHATWDLYKVTDKVSWDIVEGEYELP